MGAVARRPLAIVAAIVLFVEAIGIVLVNGLMATVVDNQSMSLAGLDPDAMSTGAWVLGGVTGCYLAVCGLFLLLAGARDRAPGRAGRAVLISAAVVHALLGAVAVGLVGWAAFAFLMVVLALIVLTLLMYGREEGGVEGGAPGGGDAPKETPAAA
ncbi:hypothetical protein [Streptomyces sp. NPDC050504]|uniref:hypothetical protein n=1 Tax=Streptomyces sp. NPDC050504 TaxID=3365618 RepID=UPI00379CB5AD